MIHINVRRQDVPELAVILVGAALMLAVLGGCSVRVPESTASLRGVVTSLTRGTGGNVTMRVVWDDDAGERLMLDAADITVTPKTHIFATDTAKRGDAVRSTADRIEVRDLVEVWITGPVLESYPVQASASDVLVFDRYPEGQPLPIPPGLTPPGE